MQIIVVGAGAAGMLAAIYAKVKAKNPNNQVTILERNNDCGKKILITGNGHCNYWNEDQSLTNYHTDDLTKLKEILTLENQKEILNFFEIIGIIPKIKNGYYYPYSNQAVSVKTALLLKMQELGIKVVTNCLVEKITKKNDLFELTTNLGSFRACKVIMAAGSKACPKTGSDGNGYSLLESLGHKLIKVLPALVQLKSPSKILKDWNGIRCDAHLTLEENDEVTMQEEGEVQLTDYGISGICTLNLSGMVAKGLDEGKKEVIKIDFLPIIKGDLTTFINWLDDRARLLKKRSLAYLFEGVLNYKLVFALLKNLKINSARAWSNLNSQEKMALAQAIKEFRLVISATKDYDNAQVCQGGVSLKEIDPLTMESKIVPALYIVGELLDVNGKCGGYNLSFAWITGMLAGKGVQR